MPLDPVPRFEHVIFPVGLGFVAGFVDVFGFLNLFGLLAAHVTGNLVFLAIDLAAGRDDLVMRIAALPIFCLAVAGSAWLIDTLVARGRHPFHPIILLEAALLALCLAAGLLLPAPTGPDDASALAIGAILLSALALQNTAMRLILNDLPPTTVMTGNITTVISGLVAVAGGFGARGGAQDPASLRRKAVRVGATLAGFFVGALAGGGAALHLGYAGMALPILMLLALLPFGREALREAGLPR